MFCLHFTLTVSWPPINKGATECRSNFVHELTVNPRKCMIRVLQEEIDNTAGETLTSLMIEIPSGI